MCPERQRRQDPPYLLQSFGAYISMRNAFTVAARILCVCLLFFFLPVGHSFAQQSPAQQTPVQQSPAQQTPAQQPQPPAAQQTAQPITAPSSQQPAVAPAPPPPPPSPVDKFFTGDGFSITLFYWQTAGHPVMGTGHQNTNGEPSDLSTLGDPKRTPSFIASVPVGKNNTVRVSYFRTQGDGNIVPTQPLIIFGTSFLDGDYLATRYTLQDAKISLDYLSWPFPVKGSKFRLKTLWEVQAIWISSSVDAPLRAGETDSAGNLIQTTGVGTDWFIYPSFGLGADYLASKNFRFEARASGFILPHLSTLWDTEVTANYRFGKFEVMAGEKGFHFKTAPRHIEFVQDTLTGIFVGLRWYPHYQSH
jgi:hypothetical protein